MTTEGCVEVVTLALSARTNAEVLEAERRIKDWIRRHPEDADYLLAAGEQLQMVKTA